MPCGNAVAYAPWKGFGFWVTLTPVPWQLTRAWLPFLKSSQLDVLGPKLLKLQCGNCLAVAVALCRISYGVFPWISTWFLIYGLIGRLESLSIVVAKASRMVLDPGHGACH